MKFLLAAVMFTGSFAFANDISPLKFGVQYLSTSIGDKPMVNFNFTVAAKDFPTMNFSQISEAIVGTNMPVVIAPMQVIYTKSPSTTISGSEILNFSYEGDLALKVIKAMRDSRIILGLNDGSQMIINLGALCSSDPESFMDLMGQSGCP